MEKVLLKLAAQLNQYDTASLMALWDVYAEKVSEFEPTKRWEEAALVFCMIQAVHWKNQLFNSEMLATAPKAKKREFAGLQTELREIASNRRRQERAEAEQNSASAARPEGEHDDESASGSSGQRKQRRKVLMFRPGDAGKS